METKTKDPQNSAISLTTEVENNSPLIDSDSDDGILSGYSLPTFPELAKSSLEHQSLLTRSQYAMVVFHGVADTYPTDSDIVCRYSLTDGVEAAPGDRVVLFAVGWSSIKDYVVFEWAPIPEKDERDLTVVFKAADLPKDVNEFYQVCYVSNESAVCGASVPFQVRTPHNEELTFALEEDMIVVRSSTAVAQDKLLKAQLDRENLNKKKVNLEKQLRSLEDKHSLTLRRLDRLQETLSTSNALNEELKKENARLLEINDQMLCVQKQLEETQIKLDNAEQEKEKMRKDAEDKTKEMDDRNRHLEIMVRELEDDLMAATEHIETLKMEHGKCQNVIAIAHENLQQSEQAKATLTSKNFALENEFKVCKFNLNNTQLESLKLKAELEDLAKNNKKLNEELRDAKQSEEMHKRFSTEYSSTDRGRLIMNNTRLLKTTEDMQLMISSLEHEKSTLKQVLEDTLNVQKNVCADHCTLEKRVAQLQYRLDEVSDEEQAVEQNQSSSHTDQSSSLASQVETLSKLLDDSLKENELRLQENMALRVQNEILQTSISKEKSTSDEFVIVSSCDSSRGFQHTSTAGSRSQNMGTSSVNSRPSIFAMKDEIDKLRQLLLAQQDLIDDYVRRLADKDAEIHDMSSEVDGLKMEFLRVKEELKLEIANLFSKNAMLVEQEIQSRELKNEMQRITFMNEELLTQNASLMARIHDDKGESSINTDTNVLEKTPNMLNVDSMLKIENEHLKEHLKSTCEELNTVRNQADRVVIDLQEYKDRCECLEKKLAGINARRSLLESKDLSKRHEMLLQRQTRFDTPMSQKCSHECCAEPKLKQISQSVNHLVSAVEKLASCSEVKEDKQSTLSDVNELKYRLELAREEYEKLHSIMVIYKTKYNELKTKYMKKVVKSNNFSN